MKNLTLIVVCLYLALLSSNLYSQDDNPQDKIVKLEKIKEQITLDEKEALKIEIEEINQKLIKKEITKDKALLLKQEIAKKRALNIDDRISIIDKKIAFINRNEGVFPEVDTLNYVSRIGIGFGSKEANDRRLFGVEYKKGSNKIEERFDIRTYSDFVAAVGLNNTLSSGSLNDELYKTGGSWFAELGVQWRTRVFKNSNALRLNYGFAFQFNNLKPKNNMYFVTDDNQTQLEEFDFDLNKSKFKRTNLVFPVHFEFGPSKFSKSENKMRYSLHKKLRVGFGGYAGFNIATSQKLKYNENGNKVKTKTKMSYNTNNFIYGLSGYVGVGGVQLYAKYDLNPLFKNAVVDQNNISVGLRFDL